MVIFRSSTYKVAQCSLLNKVSISTTGMEAVAQDNRHQKASVVSSLAWALDQDTNKPSLFSGVGFDRIGFGWKMRSKKEQKVV